MLGFTSMTEQDRRAGQCALLISRIDYLVAFLEFPSNLTSTENNAFWFGSCDGEIDSCPPISSIKFSSSQFSSQFSVSRGHEMRDITSETVVPASDLSPIARPQSHNLCPISRR